MNYDLAWDMGRQKTLWIDEECWTKLEMMEGDSISAKVRRCIEEHNVADGARVDALKRQIARLEAMLEARPKQRRTMQ